jgi:hypothetical protein
MGARYSERAPEALSIRSRSAELVTIRCADFANASVPSMTELQRTREEKRTPRALLPTEDLLRGRRVAVLSEA